MWPTIISSLPVIIGVGVGSFITWKIFTRERADKYILAALDQKIKAHQEAFDLCWDLPSCAHNLTKSEAQKHLENCKNWYRKNCLYLEPEARKAFYTAYQNAQSYDLYLQAWRATNNVDNLKIKWDEITSAITTIESNISQPLIKPAEIQKEFDFKGKVKTDI